MAKIFRTPKHQTGRMITTKTPYGSTSDMIVIDPDILNKVSIDDNCVLLKDDEGFYITNKNRLDNGLSDPFRYCTTYRDMMNTKIEKELESTDE